MKVLVVGGGGREHAMVRQIALSSRVEKIYCAPGNAGIGQLAERVPLKATEIDALADFAAEGGIDLTFVGPEAPLIGGIADTFRARGLRIFGPKRAAARLEGSKVFTKNLFRRHRIPTADFQVFSDPAEARKYVMAKGAPIVVKADGEALGKGAVIARDTETALQAIEDMMVRRVFGEAGARIVVEECLVGQEMTLQILTDGDTVAPMVPARDYKRALDNDEGLNTGGVGSYSPVPMVSPDLVDEAVVKIIEPAIEALRGEGVRYQGVLYAGLMLTNRGLRILEFNVRFGDPEAQVVLPRLKTDLVNIAEAVVERRLHELVTEWADTATVCVVMASGGYPGAYETGKPILGLEAAEATDGVIVFHAGTERQDGGVVTAGGRVLGVTGTGPTLAKARETAYQAVSQISFEGAHYRRDVAAGVE